MKKIYLFLTGCIFVSSNVIAGSALGTIAKIELGPTYGQKVFIQVIGEVTGQPACQTNANYNFAFDVSEPGGDAVLSAVLSAKAGKQKIRISGYSQCTRISGVEDLRWFRFEE